MKRLGIVLLLPVLLTGCTTIYNPATQKHESYFINDRQEVAMGVNMAEQFKKQHKMLDDPQRLAYVQAIGEKIAAQCHREYLAYHFYIIDEETINAFAVPGGHVFVYKGLLDKTDEDELAFVLGHEIAHITARHGVKRLQASLGFTFLSVPLLFLGDEQAGKATHDLANRLFTIVSQGYSRSDEFQADALGMAYTLKAGFDPEASLSLFKMFKEQAQKVNEIPFYLRSHPTPDQRIENAKKEIDRLMNATAQ